MPATPAQQHAERVAFFYEHAGYSFNPATETREQGRKRCARQLAVAEHNRIAGPYFISIEPDPEPYEGDESYDGPLWVVSLYRVDDRVEPECLASCSVVCDEGDPYLRVVAAELAVEHCC
jgi:hypothetical protein